MKLMEEGRVWKIVGISLQFLNQKILLPSHNYVEVYSSICAVEVLSRNTEDEERRRRCIPSNCVELQIEMGGRIALKFELLLTKWISRKRIISSRFCIQQLTQHQTRDNN